MKNAHEKVSRGRKVLQSFALIALAAITLLLTLNRFRVVSVRPRTLDARLKLACGCIFPSRAQLREPAVIRGVPLELPDPSPLLPAAAVEMLRSQEETVDALRTAILSEKLGLMGPEEVQVLVAGAKRNIVAARSAVKSLLKVDGRTAALVVSSLGWPWAPRNVVQWVPDQSYAAYSLRPEPIRAEKFKRVDAIRRRLEKNNKWMQEAQNLQSRGLPQEKLDAVLVWSVRLALQAAFNSPSDLRKARLSLRKFFALTPFQADWFIGLWAAQWTLKRGRFALPPLIELLRHRSETYVLIMAIVPKTDLDVQAKDAVRRYLSKAESRHSLAAAELIALGPFSLEALRSPGRAIGVEDRKRIDRIRSAVREKWSPSDVEREMPAPRWECWDRWLKTARPWL